MKRLGIVTATRAEYGLLKPLILRLRSHEEIDVCLFVTGAHLSAEFGSTWKLIEQDGLRIDEKIDILLSSDSPAAISKSMGLAMISFAQSFAERDLDALLLLGDRYESFAIAAAALNQRLPIFHLYGGETTEGAVDEAYRHSITKMSVLHLTSAAAYSRRVIQLGEAPERVFTVGAIGVENALNTEEMTREALEAQLGVRLQERFAVVTFHPVTLEGQTAGAQVDELLAAVRALEIQAIFTLANADAEGRIINEKLRAFCAAQPESHVYPSLGQLRYFNAIRHCSFVLGNSSSGLIEVPSFHKPTINIGDRQKGRLHAESVIDCEAKKDSIIEAVRLAEQPRFQDKLQTVRNPYQGEATTARICDLIHEALNGKISLKKVFFDLPEQS